MTQESHQKQSRTRGDYLHEASHGPAKAGHYVYWSGQSRTLRTGHYVLYANTPSGSNVPFNTVGVSSYPSHSLIMVA